jgi:hypothetical protein
MGRPTGFMKTIQLYSERRLNRLLKDEVPFFYRIYSRASASRHIPQGGTLKARLIRFVYRFFDRCLDVYPYQEIVVKKINA